MTKILASAVCLMLALPSTTRAWVAFLDGSVLPTGPWQGYQIPDAGSTVIVEFFDPAIAGTNQALRVNSGSGANEWYVGPFSLNESVAGARFRVVSFSTTGKENLLCATTCSDPFAPAASITLVDGRYKLWNYVDPNTPGSPGSEIMDIGPVVTNEFHTAYLFARKDGWVRLWWDGVLIFDGSAPLTNPHDGFIEWGSGSWQYDATDTVDFDWVGFGDANDLPLMLNINRAGECVVLSWPSNVTEFVLQCATNLVPADWTDLLNTPGNVYTNDLLASSQFYRLRRDEPPVVLQDAPVIQFRCANSPSPDQPGDCDCNNPAHWDGDTLYVFNSAGHPWRSSGPDLVQLNESYLRVTYNNQVNGGRWIESTWKASDGTLYGWYHFEPGGLCPGRSLTAPKIGALRSLDNGANWQDLGIVLEARTNTLRCDTANFYFAGGNGDFSVIADAGEQYLYFLFSTYAGGIDEQGVSVARMLYADRDNPTGRVWKWHAGGWNEPGLGGRVTPIFQAAIDWHQSNADAFWGPSVHWNSYLQQYVILLNRAMDANWSQEGIYLTVNDNLADPTGWSRPKEILGGLANSQWYPQVIGPDTNQRETDKLAGQVARLFVRGASRWEIRFLRPGESR